MIRAFGVNPFSRTDASAVYSIYKDPAAEQLYNVYQNLVEMNNPVSGNLSYSILEANSVAPTGTMYGQLTSGILTLSSDVVASFSNIANDYARLMIFYNGRKLIPASSDLLVSVPKGDGFISPTNLLSYQIIQSGRSRGVIFASGRTTDPSDVIETFVLSNNNLNSSLISTGSFYYQFFNRSSLIPNLFTNFPYTTINRFYNNCLVFKNGLFQRPKVDYFIDANGNLSFSTNLITSDVVEIYVLSFSTKTNRIAAVDSISEDTTKLTLPQYPRTRLKEI